MDPKKSANLTPELKEIYDRVMNTTPTPKLATPPPVQAPSALPQTPTSPQAPTPSPKAQPVPSLNAADEALSETPPRPLTTGNTFSFNGTVKAQSDENSVATTKGKSKISLPILIVLGIVFIVVWAVFWAIIFGFIKH